MARFVVLLALLMMPVMATAQILHPEARESDGPSGGHAERAEHGEHGDHGDRVGRSGGAEKAVAAGHASMEKAQVSTAHGIQDRSEKIKQRLEQLFVWRVSDRLALNPKQESDFATAFHNISEERSQLSSQLDDQLDQLEKAKSEPMKQAKIFADYETTLKKYNASQVKEMDTMKRIFDSKKVVDYVLLKREMHQKFKDVLTQNTSSVSSGSGKVDSTTLKEPEVIQEK